MPHTPTTISALDRARAKAYIRLLPLLFLSYAIAYVDRINVSLAKLEMTKDLAGFNNAVVGFGAGLLPRLLPPGDPRHAPGREVEPASGSAGSWSPGGSSRR